MTELDDVHVPPGALSESIQRNIEAAIAANVPEGKRGVLVAVLDERGARFGVAAKVGDHWQLAGDVGRTWGGDVSGRIAIAGSW